jgi:hypothetical protein
MNKLPNTLKITGKLWVIISLAIIAISYCMNMIFSEEPFVTRFFALINIWNVFLAFLIILPGYFLIILSEKLESKKNTK